MLMHRIFFCGGFDGSRIDDNMVIVGNIDNYRGGSPVYLSLRAIGPRMQALSE